MHPNYERPPYFDAAVLLADKELTLTNIRTICLPFTPTEQNEFPLIPSDEEEINDNTPFAGRFRLYDISP